MVPLRTSLILLALTAAVVLGFGCTDSALRLQSPEAFEAVLEDVRLVRDVCVPFGGHPLEVEAIVLIGNLQGTGSDPPPSSERSWILTEMQKRGVHHPNAVLASPSTSLAIARAELRAGIQKGEQFDIDVFVPASDETNSLRNGVMYEARLRERQVLGGRVREGNVLAMAKGPVLVDPMADPEQAPASLRRGRVLGGGIVSESRPMGLVLKPDDKDIRTSAQIGTAINKRFYLTTRGIKSGVANPKTDGYVELSLHPRYQDNVERYLRVVTSIALNETPVQRQVRMQLLRQQLTDPLTAASAAVRLEAIGSEAAEVLTVGMSSGDPEVRFYAAEALAYLDEPAAAPILAEAARDEPAFRSFALTALSAMDDPAARDELVKLLDVSSAETRYGAFRALWAMNPRDPVIRGEQLGDQFYFHVVNTKGPPMVHVTRSLRPEIVLFGDNLSLKPPFILDAGKQIRVNAKPDGAMSLVRYVPGQSDRRREISIRLDELVRGIAEVGGSYPDVVQALAQAKAIDALPCRFEIDAVPERGRKFYRSQEQLARSSPPSEEGFSVESPSSDLYPNNLSAANDSVQARFDSLAKSDQAESPDEQKWPLTRYVGKILGWRSGK